MRLSDIVVEPIKLTDIFDMVTDVYSRFFEIKLDQVKFISDLDFCVGFENPTYRIIKFLVIERFINMDYGHYNYDHYDLPTHFRLLETFPEFDLESHVTCGPEYKDFCHYLEGMLVADIQTYLEFKH